MVGIMNPCHARPSEGLPTVSCSKKVSRTAVMPETLAFDPSPNPPWPSGVVPAWRKMFPPSWGKENKKQPLLGIEPRIS